MSLSNIFKTLPILTVAGLSASASTDTPKEVPSADTWKISGINRVLVEAGNDAGNLAYPEMFVTAKNGDWTIQAAPDLVDTSAKGVGGTLNSRIHTATIEWQPNTFNIKTGILPPFGRRLTGQDFYKGLPGVTVGDNLVGQGGILGAQATKSFDLSDQTKLLTHIMGGTKIEDISEFGNPQSAGFDTGIWGAGVDISTVVGGANMNAGYNFTHFGEGPAGMEQDIHYIYTNLKKTLGERLTLQMLAEMQHTLNQNDALGLENSDTRTTAMLQAIYTLSKYFTLRSAVGTTNGDNSAEVALVTGNKDWKGQIGVGAVETDQGTDTVGHIAFIRSF